MTEDFGPVRFDKKEHLLFCLEFLKDFDAVESYRRVYGNDMEYYSAYSSAYRLLNRDDVQDFIDYSIINSIKESELIISDPSRTIKEIDKMAFSPDNRYPSTKARMLELRARIQGLLDGDASSRLRADREGLEDRIRSRKADREIEKDEAAREAEPTEQSGELEDILVDLHYRTLQKLAMSIKVPGNISRFDMIDGILDYDDRELVESNLSELVKDRE